MLSPTAALDTMGGDIDLEPSLVGFDGVTVPTDDREGGDVLDEALRRMIDADLAEAPSAHLTH